MQPDRPFREWPLDQLAAHARMHAAHREVVARIRHELACRPGRAARRLEAMLAAGLAAEPGGSALLAELRARLAAAEAEVASLRTRIAALDGRGDEAGEVHAALGLAPEAPRWLLIEARRAWRRRHHPDLFAGPAREEAEQRFKDIEAKFARILSTE